MLAGESAAEQHGECRAVQLLEQNSSPFGLIWMDDAQSHLLATRTGVMGFLGGLIMWKSHGYIVASIDHTYEATAVEFPDGRFFCQELIPPNVKRLSRAQAGQV